MFSLGNCLAAEAAVNEGNAESAQQEFSDPPQPMEVADATLKGIDQVYLAVTAKNRGAITAIIRRLALRSDPEVAKLIVSSDYSRAIPRFLIALGYLSDDETDLQFIKRFFQQPDQWIATWQPEELRGKPTTTVDAEYARNQLSGVTGEAMAAYAILGKRLNRQDECTQTLVELLYVQDGDSIGNAANALSNHIGGKLAVEALEKRLLALEGELPKEWKRDMNDTLDPNPPYSVFAAAVTCLGYLVDMKTDESRESALRILGRWKTYYKDNPWAAEFFAKLRISEMEQRLAPKIDSLSIGESPVRTADKSGSDSNRVQSGSPADEIGAKANKPNRTIVGTSTFPSILLWLIGAAFVLVAATMWFTFLRPKQ
jgi:hypothetical protein